MTPPPVIQVEHLRKSFGGTLAVEDVSLTVQRGEIFGILGPNGAGKTTTVECLAGLQPIDAGRVRILGLDPHRAAPRIRQLVGMQLQHARLPARLRVGEALELYASFYRDPADPAQLMEQLGLAGQRSAAFGVLSGGQQQRLSIALALVGNPRVAILDELTTGLDPQARRATWELVGRVRDRGVTVVLVTHYMDEAERLCDRLAIIDHGRVAACGRPGDLTAAPGATAYRLRLPCPLPEGVALHGQVWPALRELPDGTLEVSGGPQALTALLLTLAEHDIIPTDIRTGTRTLEDVFLEVST